MIPRVFPQWIDEEKIIDIFHKQQLGRVYKVSIIRMPDSKKRSYPIYQAFIYFSAWYETEIAFNFQQRIFGPRAQARVVYDDPWFWVVFENTKRRLSNNDKRLIRIGYQTYLNEQFLLIQEERIRQLEDKNEIEHKNELDEQLKFWAADPAMEIPVLTNIPSFTPTQSHLNWNRLTEEFAMNTLGAELDLTETAMNCAEAVLAEDTNELELTETATSVAEAVLAEEKYGYDLDDEKHGYTNGEEKHGCCGYYGTDIDDYTEDYYWKSQDSFDQYCSKDNENDY